VFSVAELAQTRGVRECLQWFTREKQWINEQHLQLCRIPAPTFLEQKRAEWMAEQFRGMGCAVEIDRAGNVVARTDPGAGPGEPLVALTAHLDTVLAPRNRDEIVVDGDGRFRGPGVSDNGAGLAALLAVARSVRSSPALAGLQSSLALVANVGEEGEGNLSGMRYLCRPSPAGLRLQSFLVLDGAGVDHITWQALASRRFEVGFSGPGGHSWSDYGNGNPVHALGHAIALFTGKFPNGDRSGGNGTGGVPRSSFNVGLVEGGSSVNSIPASARAKVDLRSESSQRIGELVELLTASVERALEAENQRATGGKIAARIREIGSRPGGQLPANATLLGFLRAVDAHLGIRPRLDCASTDANIPLSLGIPAVSIGAGGQGGGAHTAAEWFHPEGRDLGLKRILLTLVLLLRDDSGAG
jgi:acetylornithine deacetylase/succinyl-diaminopimelate desuccinylase-like protein